jgi:omega-6 fatty acid desaturase (delta-12 desaturase)
MTTTTPATIERSEREILDSTRPFARDDRARSWGHVAATFALLAASAWGAIALPWWPLRVAASIVEGLTLVRAFILFHDFLHGAILRGSLPARALFTAYGMLVLTPPRVWRDTHNYHHAHNGKIVGSHVGSYPIATVAMYARMTRAQRFAYRAARHPLTIALGYFTVFGWGMCVGPFLRAPRKNAGGVVALAVQAAIAWATVRWLGWSAYALGVLGPLMLATALGGYLFYAQHNFEGARFQPRESWSYVRAALESSSYMPMGPVMRFFAGNIGYHHVHHLNPGIPFYRLPDAMAAIPELQSPKVTRLRWHDVVAGFRLALWSPADQAMIGDVPTEI